MSGARLRELRLVGFKSFAERTVVELGPGISAVVGPNGSGKSNLADALRWALGEQGRALRSRRAEDLIFAGSATRRAVGMADVSLVIDNADRLLPVDFGEVELSRRLFRSGENEYLLNRERVRLRDLVELLDDANMADNAFLFIGQGMVDQALALRPEERRPLFEEAAGIRKHQRRRGRAEAELLEAEANLERVRDLLGELRPQARRLAAQAEQQEARVAAGVELAEALVVAARSRLSAAEAAASRHGLALEASRAEADAALSALREAEETAAARTRALSERAEVEGQLRARWDEVRAIVQGIELAGARAASDAAALARERARLGLERAALLERAEEARRRIAAVLPEPDRAVEEAFEGAEHRLAEAARDVDVQRGAGRGDGERASAVRAVRERLRTDADRASRRAAEAERRLRAQRDLVASAREAADRATRRAGEAAARRTTSHAAEEAGEQEAGAARSAAGGAEAAASAVTASWLRLRAEVDDLTARREALDAQLRGGADEQLLRSLGGGRRFADGLEVEPDLRLAVEAALGDVLAGLVLDVDAVRALADAAAVLVLRDGPPGRARGGDRAVDRLAEVVLEVGGGWLVEALRTDPEGHAGRLLARCAWVPDLEAALRAREHLPAGWRVVTRSGLVVDDLGVIRPAPQASMLERRASRDEVARRLEQAVAELAAVGVRAAEAEAAHASAEDAVVRAREVLEAARRARRVDDEADRVAASAAVGAARELAWQEALLQRAEAEADATAEEARQSAAELERLDDARDRAEAGLAEPATLAALEERLVALRQERDRLAALVREARAVHDAALEERRRAEVGLGLAEARIEELDREEARLIGREADVSAEGERLARELAGAGERLAEARAALEASASSARGERADLLASEAAAGEARERLRLAEGRSRASEVAQMEARIGADAARESLLVELASIGHDGLTTLLAQSGLPPPDSPPGSEQLPELLEAALDGALEAWRRGARVAEQEGGRADEATAEVAEPPSAARIAALRRRFNDVGAGNPFAAQELAEVRARLESLEAQREDLERAIRDTRELMARLETLMTERFRDTFAALEGAFAQRFRQLFGGGEAQLSLTDPDDLGSTGVEITARPPGKRRQPLAMLSGGERALTAVALLLAMLEVRPVPFCVLDEVDAALDEANIGRFSAALRTLARDIQFIVITHNRGTIEAADALYGVTVGDDAVSRVVSLRLSEIPTLEPEERPSPVAVP
jgi:chromosome segregation protein